MSILVTRSNLSGEKLIQRIKSLGRMAFHIPLIKIIPGNELTLLSGKLPRLIDDDQVFSYQQIRYGMLIRHFFSRMKISLIPCLIMI
ncbi:MAG: uroporphyrinogen-III synthase [Arsenophonus sp. NC-TX2-MAG3]